MLSNNTLGRGWVHRISHSWALRDIYIPEIGKPLLYTHYAPHVQNSSSTQVPTDSITVTFQSASWGLESKTGMWDFPRPSSHALQQLACPLFPQSHSQSRWLRTLLLYCSGDNFIYTVLEGSPPHQLSVSTNRNTKADLILSLNTKDFPPVGEVCALSKRLPGFTLC